MMCPFVICDFLRRTSFSRTRSRPLIGLAPTACGSCLRDCQLHIVTYRGIQHSKFEMAVQWRVRESGGGVCAHVRE